MNITRKELGDILFKAQAMALDGGPWQMCRPFTDLSGADLSYVDLTGAKLTDANLDNADLASANIFRANLQDANVDGATWIDGRKK